MGVRAGCASRLRGGDLSRKRNHCLHSISRRGLSGPLAPVTFPRGSAWFYAARPRRTGSEIFTSHNRTDDGAWHVLHKIARTKLIERGLNQYLHLTRRLTQSPAYYMIATKTSRKGDDVMFHIFSYLLKCPTFQLQGHSLHPDRAILMEPASPESVHRLSLRVCSRATRNRSDVL